MDSNAEMGRMKHIDVLVFSLTKKFDLHQSVKFSVAVASLSCREYGGRKGIPDMTQALEVANKLEEKVIGTSAE